MSEYVGTIVKCEWLDHGAWLIEVSCDQDDREHSAATTESAAKRHALGLVRRMSGSNIRRLPWEKDAFGAFSTFSIEIKEEV